MKILSWNIRQGGSSRIKNIVLECLKENPNILIFTEYRNNYAGDKLKKTLFNNGFKYFHHIHLEKNINTVLIATQAESSLDKTFHKNISEKSRKNILKVIVDSVSIYGVYFPQKNEKKQTFKILLKEMESLKENTIFIGDFNTGKHFIDEKQKTFYCAEDFKLLENNDFIDAWRSENGDKKEYSWFSRIGNGFRIDHAFISKRLSKNLKCYYNHNVRIEKLSDHSMLVLEI